VHDAKNRRGFADGAVRAAEWLVGKTGFYEFRKIYRDLPA
jgi:4-hydroxy-tetrahydrodipicolinate reductase